MNWMVWLIAASSAITAQAPKHSPIVAETIVHEGLLVSNGFVFAPPMRVTLIADTLIIDDRVAFVAHRPTEQFIHKNRRAGNPVSEREWMDLELEATRNYFREFLVSRSDTLAHRAYVETYASRPFITELLSCGDLAGAVQVKDVGEILIHVPMGGRALFNAPDGIDAETLASVSAGVPPTPLDLYARLSKGRRPVIMPTLQTGLANGDEGALAFRELCNCPDKICKIIDHLSVLQTRLAELLQLHNEDLPEPALWPR